MYNVRRKTEKFDTDVSAELQRYNDIINDPLCSVISEKKEKLREEHYDDEGKLMSFSEKIILVVTWDEKVLA